ncbi:FAD-binding oxidoreductase [Modestobacter sp. VKM Ac-2979]|uniref:FAD-binding oxidoreductase n=1 Tax=unclassified Modestobacter TaxID=2643866 RepID=UPI0022AB8632|nr:MULTISPECIES: FAD-binding oxidoreductase [unclassified Modestobacter]MCZ2811310.1 FAD-binding oxidoreductase [Modestobacter sp. VKM Ac-2979]MCZ2840823.1 FAD-binding oxidoreductase [Modestobacter sp. VKM Ac-2980]
MTTVDLDTARTALSDACGEVTDATPADAVDGVPAALVARPGSTEETAAVLRAAAAAGLTVVPRGRGTKLTWGRPPESADVVLDLSRMNRVLDHAAGDLIVDTEAGALFSDVQQAAGSAGQRLALDEPIAGGTVGGMLATNASGPGRVAVGTARDLLIGVTVVRADGVVAKAGGRVVKNVAGYDLGKLVIGSFGTLVVVTRAVFRLHPVPAARRFVSVPFGSAEDASRLVQSVVHAQVVPAAVEVEWRADGAGTVGVLLEGTPAGVEARTASTRQLLGDGASAAEEAPAGWGVLPWTEEPGSTGLKLTCALSGLAPVLTAARRAADDAGVQLTVRGSGGAGVLYAALAADAPVDAVAGVVARTRAVCTEHGGSLVVLDGPPAVKTAVDTWGPVPAIDLMRRVKEQFDPERRLAPGRFVGGI